MKKLSKLYWIVSAVLTVAGISVMTAGAFQMKAENQLQSALTADVAPAENCHKIQIDVSGAEIIIEQAEDDRISLSFQNQNLTEYEFKNDTLYIRDKKTAFFSNLHFIDIGLSSQKNEIYVSMPEKTYQTIAVSSGYGDIRLSGIACETLCIDSGAGNTELNSVTAETADFDLGAGNLTADECTFGVTAIENGAGNAELKDITLNGNADLHCGAGNITLGISGGSEPYQIDCSECIGDVKINQNQTKQLCSEQAEYQITAVTVGNVEISFTE